MRTRSESPDDVSAHSDMLRNVTIDDLRALGMIANTGSMNGAARRYGVTKSVLSRAISRIEEIAGGPLFDRTAHGMTLTSTGEIMLPVALRALDLIRDAEAAFRSAKGTPQGALRIAASALAGQHLVAPALAQLARDHPKVETTLTVVGGHAHPVADDFDVVLQIGRPAEAGLTARRIARTPLALYVGSHTDPQLDLEDSVAVESLGRIVIAVENVPAIWRLSRSDASDEVAMSTPPLLRMSDPGVATGVLLAGSGVMLMPMIYAEPLRRDGRLQRAMKDHTGGTVELYAVLPPRRAVIPAVAAFLDILGRQAQEMTRLASPRT